MRFGRNFPARQLPKCACSHVNYDRWKFLAKAARYDALKEALSCDSLAVKRFLDSTYDVVAQQLSILNDEYGVTLDSWQQESLGSIPACEKDDITAALAEICSLLTYLGDYISVTQQAISRISARTSRLFYVVESLRDILQTATAQWAKNLQGINTILRDLHRPNSPNKGNTSLLLSNLRFDGDPETLEEALVALRDDSTIQLERCLQSEALQGADPSSQLAMLVLTKIGILCSSSKCLPLLISRLGANFDFNRHASLNPLRVGMLHAARLSHHDLMDQDAHRGARLVLDNLPPVQWSNVLLFSDSLGRLALHYAAQHGMAAVCKEMTERLNSVRHFTTKDSVPIFLIPDNLGETPLSIAITQGHIEIVKLFLGWLRVPTSGDQFGKEMLYDLVSLAIRSQRADMTDILIEYEPRLITSHSKVHQLLYLASQYGQASIVEKLSALITNVNVGEPLNGRTPLMIASIYGHIDVVKVLLSHPRCDVGVRDCNGWTAVDHAAFKGTPDLVKTLQDHGRGYEVSLASRLTEHGQRTNISSRHSKSQNYASRAVELDGQKGNHSHIFMNLGHFDMEKEPLILHIDPFRRMVAPLCVPDSSLTLEISTIDCEAPRQYSVSFPVLEDLLNDPFYFTAEDPNAAKLLFRVHCSVLGSNQPLQEQSHIGSAVVSLKDLRRGLGPSLESLERDHTVSLVSSDVLGSKYIGSLTFTFVISKPFVFDGLPPTPSRVELRRDGSPLVAGHRGLGQNNAKTDRLQLGENTMDSFFAALDLGADILEFGRS
ncbi:hypothetical protein GGR53DRAFT_527666 [Hypoxylon sp. FL1150]|nr:hypothetical protein GGR53DRAFT_527666 [Hypoxylon sp. FL1150]